MGMKRCREFWLIYLGFFIILSTNLYSAGSDEKEKEKAYKDALANFDQNCKSQDPSNRIKAVENLFAANYPKKEITTVDRILSVLKAEPKQENPSDEIFNVCTNGFMKITDKNAISKLISSAENKNEDEKVRLCIIKALNTSDDTRIASLMKELVSDNSQEIQIIAIDFLDKKSDKIYYSTFSNVLKDNKRSWEVKLAAVKAYAKLAIIDQLPDLKQEFDEKLSNIRKEALRVIFDTKIYLTEEEGGLGQSNPGQKIVDEWIGKARKIWNTSVKRFTKDDPQFVKKLTESIQKSIGKEYLKNLGDDDISNKLKEIEDIINLILNTNGRKFVEYNRQVEEYNEKLQDKDVTPEVKKHVKIVNDYRAMLGLKKLFIDPRLVRAAKKHSEKCNTARKIWHDGPDGTRFSRLKAEGFQEPSCSENVQLSSEGTDPQRAFDAWYVAADHHRNMLNDQWVVIGWSYVGMVSTQYFGICAPPR